MEDGLKCVMTLFVFFVSIFIFFKYFLSMVIKGFSCTHSVSGFHNWSPWDDSEPRYQYRSCLKCGKKQMRDTWG